MNIKDALRDLMAAREERRLARIAYSDICSKACTYDGRLRFKLITSEDGTRRYWVYADPNVTGNIWHDKVFQEWEYLRTVRAELNRKHGIAVNKFFRQAKKLLKEEL